MTIKQSRSDQIRNLFFTGISVDDYVGAEDSNPVDEQGMRDLPMWVTDYDVTSPGSFGAGLSEEWAKLVNQDKGSFSTVYDEQGIAQNTDVETSRPENGAVDPAGEGSNAVNKRRRGIAKISDEEIARDSSLGISQNTLHVETLPDQHVPVDVYAGEGSNSATKRGKGVEKPPERLKKTAEEKKRNDIERSRNYRAKKKEEFARVMAENEKLKKVAECSKTAVNNRGKGKAPLKKIEPRISQNTLHVETMLDQCVAVDGEGSNSAKKRGKGVEKPAKRLKTAEEKREESKIRSKKNRDKRNAEFTELKKLVPENEKLQKLMPENERLTAENEKLKKLIPENERLTAENEKLQRLIPENESITAENERLTAENERLKKLIPENERLTAENERLKKLIPENEWLTAENEKLIPENDHVFELQNSALEWPLENLWSLETVASQIVTVKLL